MNIHFLFTQTNIVGGGKAMSLSIVNNSFGFSNFKRSIKPFKRKIKISKILAVLVLLAIQAVSYGQDDNTRKGLFDINSSVKATSKSSLVEADGFGTSHYKTKKLPNGNLKVRYTYDKPQAPNPFFITYAYQIEKRPSGDVAMDMQAAMPPFSLYIDTNATMLSYTGDKIILPNHPTTDSLLPNAAGRFQLKMLETNEVLLSYQVELTNRKIVKEKDITLNGKPYEVYLHSYDFLQKTIINNDQVLTTIQEKVTEWLIPNYGQVLQNRTGTQVTTTTANQLTTESKLQSTLSHLNN